MQNTSFSFSNYIQLLILIYPDINRLKFIEIFSFSFN
jgi:hypothetical protein